MIRPVPLALLALVTALPAAAGRLPDTGQTSCYGSRGEIRCPAAGRPFHGQDAQYAGPAMTYRDNGDGTVDDRVTGLTWSKAVSPTKLSLEEAERAARELRLGGHDDWRVPNIKELYSLIDFRGYTGFGRGGMSGGAPSNAIPFINTDYFDFAYGDTGAGERYIDAQWLSATHYVGYTMGRNLTLFGVNFADGRIKGYGYAPAGRRPGPGPGPDKRFYVRYVRGAPYGENRLEENGDGTVSDHASGLDWARADSGKALTWEEALGYCEGLSLGGRDDWRLPNAKELQYLVDYGRAPDTSDSAAIDPRFETTAIVNEAGQRDFPFFWSSTTHLDGPRPGLYAAYVSFGRGLGEMHGRVMDVHGAGAQRSDPKVGSPQLGHGPQGDAVRVSNFARCVRGGEVVKGDAVQAVDRSRYPYRLRVESADGRAAGRISPFNNASFGGGGGSGGEGPSGGGGGFGPPGGGGFVQHLDRDGDGRVSRSEFDGPPDRFDVHDRDGDGYLTDEEAPHLGGGMPFRTPGR